MDLVYMVNKINPEIEKWIANNPQEDWFKHQFLDKNASNFLVQMNVRVGLVVLDVGCGSGKYSLAAAELVGNEGKIYALDIDSVSLHMLEEEAAREGLENIFCLNVSGEKSIPIEDQTVDIVLLIDVLYHIKNRGFLFDEIQRILKPDGSIIVYPMHVAESELNELTSIRSFELAAKEYGGRILCFKKSEGYL